MRNLISLKFLPTRLSLVIVYTCILSILLVSCAQVGMPVPQTFNQRLAVGYSTVTAVRSTAFTLLEGGYITVENAQSVQDQADKAREGLDIAANVVATNPVEASNRLTASLVVLNALQTYLKTRSQK